MKQFRRPDISFDPSVLLVDDEPTIVALYAHAVRRQGFEAVTFNHPTEAIERIAKARPRLVVSDVQMPGMDGFEFAHELCRRGYKNFPMLFMTAQSGVGFAKTALEAGGDDLLLKGSSAAAIMERMVIWVGSGFLGLPARLRGRALAAAAAMQEDTNLADLLMPRAGMIESVAAHMKAELHELPKDFGVRLYERAQIMGRATALLEQASTGDFGALMRFPDHMVALMFALGFDWAPDAQPLFARFDLWSEDLRFRQAEAGLAQAAA